MLKDRMEFSGTDFLDDASFYSSLLNEYDMLKALFFVLKFHRHVYLNKFSFHRYALTHTGIYTDLD